MAELRDLRIQLEGLVERLEEATASLEEGERRLREGGTEGLVKAVRLAASPEVEAARAGLKKRAATEPVLAALLARFHEVEVSFHRELSRVAEAQGKASFSALATAERLELGAPAPAAKAPRPVGPPPRAVVAEPLRSEPPALPPPPAAFKPTASLQRATRPDEVLYELRPRKWRWGLALSMLAPISFMILCLAVPEGSGFVGWVPLLGLLGAAVAYLVAAARGTPRILVTGRAVHIGSRVLVSTREAPLTLEYEARVVRVLSEETDSETVVTYTLRSADAAHVFSGALPGGLREALWRMEHPPREIGFSA